MVKKKINPIHLMLARQSRLDRAGRALEQVALAVLVEGRARDTCGVGSAAKRLLRFGC